MVTPGTLISVAIDGLAFGIFLALLGVGITLVFGLGEILNLAIGAFSIIAVFATWTLVDGGQGLFVAVPVALALVAVLALVIDRTLISPAYRATGEQRILLGIFITLGVTVFLDGFLLNGLDLSRIATPFVIPGFPSSYNLPLGLSPVSYAGVLIRASSAVVIVSGAVVLVVLFAFLRLTFIGKATRTVFQDELGAQLVGVNPRRIRSMIFVLSAVVAGVAGIIWALGHNVNVAAGFQYTVFALIVSIVGGVRSLMGAITAGILLGLVNGFANFFVGSYVATVILFSAAVVFLLARPEAIT